MDKIVVFAPEMRSEFRRILLGIGFSSSKADICADLFTDNTLEGVSSHGINRFPRFVDYVKRGYIISDAEPVLLIDSPGLEKWDGNLGPGPLNAIFAADRAVYLAEKNGIGLVTLRNTNHWMRGGSYGWRTARKGFAFIGWTNTEANMPAWGAKDYRLGNNPLVFAVPYKDEAIVLDFAMTQFSYGKMESYMLSGEKLPFPGGFDSDGQLTYDPRRIIETRRALPIGYWKGSGLSLLLDILASSLSEGASTCEVSAREAEYGLSQVFIAISMDGKRGQKAYAEVLKQIIEDVKSSVPAGDGICPRIPGENTMSLREKNLRDGIPVNRNIWESVLKM